MTEEIKEDNKRSFKKMLSLTERQVEMIKHIKQAEGYPSDAMVFYVALNEYFESRYVLPPYKRSASAVRQQEQQEPQLSDEQMCEAMGGKVENEKCKFRLDGNSKVSPTGAMVVGFPFGDYLKKAYAEWRSSGKVVRQ